MSLVIDDKGTISLYQGDSGDIVISGLDINRNYTVYFAVQDKKRNLIGNELQVTSNKADSVIFFLTPDFTDLLKVPSGKAYEIYTYGIKVCEEDADTEDTLFVADGNYGDENVIIVYPRKVIGG